MELKTKVVAEDNKQEMLITREFDLPVELLFRAYADPEIVEQWMGTKVITLDNKDQGSYRFETTDPKGNVHVFCGAVHSFSSNEKIVRTFEMAGKGLGVQLEFLEFAPVTADTSTLKMHIVFESVNHRDEMIRIGMDKGMNMAHNRLQDVASKLK